MGYFLSCIALAHFAAGRYDSAVEWAQRSLGREPDYYVTHGTLAASRAHLGHVDAASRAAQEMLGRNPGFSPGAFSKVFAIADPTFIENWLAGLRMAGLKE
jgi:tetratricopeptide (TPR) repeat protein